jgi:hypothetical protein
MQTITYAHDRTHFQCITYTNFWSIICPLEVDLREWNCFFSYQSMKIIGLLKVCFLLGFIGWNVYLMWGSSIVNHANNNLCTWQNAFSMHYIHKLLIHHLSIGGWFKRMELVCWKYVFCWGSLDGICISCEVSSIADTTLGISEQYLIKQLPFILTELESSWSYGSCIYNYLCNRCL